MKVRELERDVPNKMNSRTVKMVREAVREAVCEWYVDSTWMVRGWYVKNKYRLLVLLCLVNYNFIRLLQCKAEQKLVWFYIVFSG